MFVIEVPYFNLDQIYNSGQAPRWIKLMESKYVIPHRDKALKIEQQRDRSDWTKYRLIMNCTEEEFYNIWFEYFDLKTDYMGENRKIKKLGGKFKVPATRGEGIHILNQDTFEAHVFAKLITYVGYEKAKIAMNHIAEVCGIKHVQSMREAGKVTWYEWPTPEMVLNNFDKLKRMGKINNWLKETCESIVNGECISEPDEVFKLFDVFASHTLNTFPITGIEGVLTKNFDCAPEEFADWYLTDVENKGLAYTYIVHHVLNKPKEEIPDGINR